MANGNENDEVQPQNSNNNVAGAAVGQTKQVTSATNAAESGRNEQSLIEPDNGAGDEPTCARGKLNDLVADLCINGTAERSSLAANGGFGDYTNIRATIGPYVENSFTSKSDPFLDNHSTSGCADVLTQQQQQPHIIQPPTQISSFSFKHFLNSSCAMTAPSTTVTSLDPVGATSSSSVSLNNNSGISAAVCSTNPLQTSTGARPKVPQSASVSSTSISSLSAGGAQDSSSATKMKRSPRFSSFDSQASLAKHAGANEVAMLDDHGIDHSGGNATGFRQYSAALGTDNDSGENDGNIVRSNSFQKTQQPIHFTTRNFTNTSAATSSKSGGHERQYVPRSFSNYDMPMPPASPRRRAAPNNFVKEARPNRLALNVNSSKLKLDLPIDNAANVSTTARSNAGEFLPAAAVAAALPDFVQDHWMESWYAPEMHLSSPPNSPVGDFAREFAATGGAAGNANMGAGATVGTGAGTCGGTGSSGSSMNIASTTDQPTVGSKMLPDFLSDGPIIHSSQRLADVAAGLPSNSIGSPEDPPMSQLSRLRLENERLQRELDETRTALIEQTRRGNDLERQLQEVQHTDDAYNRSMSQNITQAEENLDKSKRRTAAAQSHVMKLKQQVTQLTTEVETLRRENETLREEGAVGGCSAQSCERPYATAAASARANVARPSRSQAFARDLRKAASNAESNLKQLLAGVDNLRQMAADIEHAELRLDYDASPDLFSDFLDECEEYEEYPGGPAL